MDFLGMVRLLIEQKKIPSGEEGITISEYWRRSGKLHSDFADR